MILIEAIRTNNSTVCIGLAFDSIAGIAPGSVASLASSSDADPAFDSVNDSVPSSVTGPAPGFFAVSVLGFIDDFVLDSVTVPACGAIAGCVSYVVIDPKKIFFIVNKSRQRIIPVSNFILKWQSGLEEFCLVRE